MSSINDVSKEAGLSIAWLSKSSMHQKKYPKKV
jgi:hypothetical protein